MKPRDVEIWERFIDKYPDAYETCQYDLHVGDPPTFNTLMDDGTDRNQAALYQLKIDVVGRTPDHIDIIEVKPDAGPATIGQVLGYRALYIRDEKPTQPINMVIVTNMERLNMDFLARNAGVRLVVV